MRKQRIAFCPAHPPFFVALRPHPEIIQEPDRVRRWPSRVVLKLKEKDALLVYILAVKLRPGGSISLSRITGGDSVEKCFFPKKETAAVNGGRCGCARTRSPHLRTAPAANAPPPVGGRRPRFSTRNRSRFLNQVAREEKKKSAFGHHWRCVGNYLCFKRVGRAGAGEGRVVRRLFGTESRRCR
jgi:hypothetical protein